MKRLGALALALALIAGAIFINQAIHDDDSSSGEDTTATKVRVTCATEFAAACKRLDATVTIEAPGTTADRLAAESTPGFDLWITSRPWPESVVITNFRLRNCSKLSSRISRQIRVPPLASIASSDSRKPRYMRTSCSALSRSASISASEAASSSMMRSRSAVTLPFSAASGLSAHPRSRRIRSISVVCPVCQAAARNTKTAPEQDLRSEHCTSCR